MKAIKIILGIIIAISVVFFATGFIVSETEFTVAVEINKPIKEVFLLSENLEIQKKWMPEIQTKEIINETPQKIGSTYKLIVKSQGRDMEMNEKVLAYEINRKKTLYFTTETMVKIDDYNFISQGTKTKLVQKSTIRAKSFMLACTFPWFKSHLKDINQETLNRFKALAEQ